MDFYASIAKYYDNIFPPNPKQVELIRGLLSRGDRILDIGCATGSLAVALAKDGYHVRGIDLDEKLIKIAKLKATALNKALLFEVGDMLKLGESYPGGSSNCVVTIGNTLVHLPSDKVQGYLEGAYAYLQPGGTLVLQIINYDRIIKEEITELPLIDNEWIRFERHYGLSRLPGKIDFNTTLEAKKVGVKMQNTIALHPLLHAELKNMLIQAGFGNMESYGNFNKDPYRSDSYALVMVARKPNV